MQFYAAIVLVLVAAPLCFGDDVCMQALTRRNYKDMYADVADCHYYFQCFFHNESYAEGIRRQCAAGLFWHDQVLSCLPEGKVPCQDRCLDDQTHAKGCYVGAGCRQYFKCANTASYGMCCPEGTRFNEATCSCDEDLACHDVCVMDAPLVPTTAEPAKQLTGTTCLDSFGSKISLVSGQPNAYIQLDADGNPTEKMFCADSTSFNLVTCRCDTESESPLPVQKQQREPIFWVDFDNDTNDKSMSRFATFLFDGAQRDAASFALGSGSLRVNNGFVSIPGMKTFDLGRAASFCGFFKCDAAPCGAGGILSNLRDQNEYTVVVGVEAPNMLTARLLFWHPVGTLTVRAPFTIPQNGWNHFCLTYDGNAMRLFLNGGLADTQFVGSFLSISSVAYEIGRDALLGSFVGNVDDVLVAPFALTSEEVENHRTGKQPLVVTVAAPVGKMSLSEEVPDDKDNQVTTEIKTLDAPADGKWGMDDDDDDDADMEEISSRRKSCCSVSYQRKRVGGRIRRNINTQNRPCDRKLKAICQDNGQLFMLRTAMAFKSAERACNRAGMKLVDLRTERLLRAFFKEIRTYQSFEAWARCEA